MSNVNNALMSNQQNLANLVASSKSITSKYIVNKTSCFLHVHQQKEGRFLEERTGLQTSVLLLKLFAQSSEMHMSWPNELTSCELLCSC